LPTGRIDCAAVLHCQPGLYLSNFIKGGQSLGSGRRRST